MDMVKLKKMAFLGEDSRHEFKVDVRNPDSLAAEMVAFSNSHGGQILIGINDDGKIIGVTVEDVRRINQLIGNVASQKIRSPISVETENIQVEGDRVVIILTVPKGLDKPYFDNKGVIWQKAGSDKRRINSKEELQRLFQSVEILHGDEFPTRAEVSEIDRIDFREFLNKNFSLNLTDNEYEYEKLLENMNLAENGKLNIAGLLLFGKTPHIYKPVFIVKSVQYPGSDIIVSDYVDSEDFYGPLSRIYRDSLAFIMRNLKKLQYGQSVNSIGKPEVPTAVFEELLVNALVHRDYLINSHIRILVFDDRVEIISPGNLPNHLTVKKILAGNSNIRNPILASFVAKGILPYKGLGTGIRRAVHEWPYIEFENDKEQMIFKAIIHRPEIKGLIVKEPRVSQLYMAKNIGRQYKSLTKFQEELLNEIKNNTSLTYDDLVLHFNVGRSTIMRNLKKMKDSGLIQRFGSKKTGYWKILN